MLGTLLQQNLQGFRLAQSPQRRGRVLIADDQADFRLFYKRVLVQDGWDIIEATNGKEVLERVLEQPPDVIVLDNKMPQMTGEDAYESLRALDFDIPIVFISAAGEVQKVADRLGINLYLGKPFRPSDLTNAVQFAYGIKPAFHF